MQRLLRLASCVLSVVAAASCADNGPAVDGGGRSESDVCVDSDCLANASCHGSSKGSCACDDGFAPFMSDKLIACVDVDECLSGVADCSRDGICTNTLGSFECACAPGFEGDGRDCRKPEACEDVECAAPATCAVQGDHGVCVCPDGYAQAGNGCTDIDECAIDSDDCADDALCTNEDGGFSCKCRDGFDGDGKQCVAKSECIARGLECAEQATCVKRDGSFRCACGAGYQGNGENCTDVDECALNHDGCDVNATCSNTAGSFTCTCRTGFSGDGMHCADIDECSLGTDNCDGPSGPNVTCENTAGSWSCVCAAGYVLDHEICVARDSVAPTITITADHSQLAVSETATITFTLSEPASDFVAGELSVDGGTLSGFTGSGTSYHATFTPLINSTLAARFDVPAGRFHDASGNPNVAATRLTIAIDTLLPTLVIQSDKPTLKAGQVAILSFTLSEPTTGFTLSDVVAAGGTLSAFAGSGASYTALFTPLADTNVSATIDIAASAFTDAAGNPSIAPAELVIPVTTQRPTISVSSDDLQLNVGDSASVTFTLSAASSDFAAGDVSVSGGTLSAFSGNGSAYTATFTPTAASTTAATIDVAGGVFNDGDGNNNVAATQVVIAVDTVAPSALLTADDVALKLGESAQLTIALSEAASDFAQGDLTVSGCTVSGFQGSGQAYSALLTPATDQITTCAVSVAAGVFTDAAANANVASAQLDIAVDRIAPTVVITSDDGALRIGESATLTFALSEAASDFGAGDVSVSGGTLSAFSGSGAQYTATLTPSASSTAQATVDVAAGGFTDAAGNANVAATQLAIDVDTVAPTVTIGSSAEALKAGETAALTFTLSESASDFVVGDVSVSGGSLSAFSGSGGAYTATFTPTAASTTAATIDVAGGVFSDVDGNSNVAATQVVITVDTVLPSVLLTADDVALKLGESAQLTIALSEAASDFAQGDLTVSGCTVSAFQGSGQAYSALLTPATDQVTACAVSVAAGVFTDAATNPNVASAQLDIAVDRIAPTVVITSDDDALRIGESATLTFALSEAASDFGAGDVSVSGGTLSAFSGSGAQYTATLTPSASSTAQATVDVAAGGFTDAAGNANVAATQRAIDVDTVAPTVTIGSSAEALKAGETAALTFTLSESASNFAVGDVTVSGGSLSAFSGSGTSYSATFTPTIGSTETASIAVDAAVFSDAAGNANTTSSSTLIPVDTVLPMLTISSNDSALKIGDVATLTFTLSEASSNFGTGDVAVTGGTLGVLSGSGTSYSATFTPSAGSTTSATVDVAASAFSDAAGNGNVAATQLVMTVDTIAPTVSISSNDSNLTQGEVATLTFALSEAASDFAAVDIAVTGGTLGVLSGSGASYSATFTPTPSANLTATVDVAAAGFSDAAGNGNLAATQLTITVATQPPCGDGVVAGGEQCDDAPPAENGDGCSATCTVELGFSCSGSPSICTTTCGDGVKTSNEACDDGCLAGTAHVCEPSDNGDGCSSTCTLECGNSVLNGTEQCDDGNGIDGDGCSASCKFELSCGVGEDLIQIRSTDVPKAIPDSNPTGVDSNAVVPAGLGAVRKVMVGIGRITHTYDADLLVSLRSPSGKRRNLIANRGTNVQNFITTRLDDSAAVAISSGTAPYSSAFRPEQTISDLAGYRELDSGGTWQLRAVDSGTGDTGTIVGWTLSLCVDPAVVCPNGFVEGNEECDDNNSIDNDACSNVCTVTDGCGDGNIDAGEQCDDDNVIAGDGCSPTCQIDIGCGAGETAVVVRNTSSIAIPDATPAGVLSPVTIATAGAVRRVQVFIGGITHTDDGDIDMFLVSPGGTRRELSTDNVSGGQNYAQTFFDDSAATSITAGTPPFSGRFRSEVSMSTTAGKDFRNLNAAGTWNLNVIDDAGGDTGTLDSWALALCVDPTAGYCGNGSVDAGEECDDNNAVDNDACSNMCALVDGCGDGNIDAGEECDDDNLVSGDGCSSSCVLDISCGVGEVPVVLRNATATAIPDNAGGLLSTINVALPGVVRKLIPTVSIAHAVDAHLDIFLASPYGLRRELSTDQTGVNYVATSFSDTAATAITAGTAPYTGAFRPEQTISTAAPGGFGNQTATGSWTLHVSDDTAGTTGTLNSWGIALCIDPSVSSVCGNGIVELSETCDDGNTVGGDGCSSSCQVELSCPIGQTTTIVRATGLPAIIPDNTPAGLSSTVTVSAFGVVTKAILVVGALSHSNDAHIDASLISPAATTIDISSDNGGTGDDYASTIFDDAAATAITAGVSPFRGRFRPEVALSGFNNQSAAGTWTFKVVDDTAVDAGILSSWTLGLCVQDD